MQENFAEQELLSFMFDRLVSGDQAAADALKAELTGCVSFSIPSASVESEEAAMSNLYRVFGS